MKPHLKYDDFCQTAAHEAVFLDHTQRAITLKKKFIQSFTVRNAPAFETLDTSWDAKKSDCTETERPFVDYLHV
jgi:hypothetical protein